MKKRHATKQTPSTQKYLNIAEIRDDSVVMKDGTLRAVLLVSSINFALKSEDEQNAIVAGYVTFLNLLDFPVQIVIQSRQLDLDEYLAMIKEAEEKQTNELLKIQTAEYKQYITELVEMGDIMTKRFFVVVPYDPVANKKRSFTQRTGDIMSPTKVIKLNQKEFFKRQKELFALVDRVLSGLASMGIRASILETQALIELYYTTYNPTVSRSEKLTEVGKLQMEDF
ncbi:MAG: TraC family protein [Patescibacteria group bacterium]